MGRSVLRVCAKDEVPELGGQPRIDRVGQQCRAGLPRRPGAAARGALPAAATTTHASPRRRSRPRSCRVAGMSRPADIPCSPTPIARTGFAESQSATVLSRLARQVRRTLHMAPHRYAESRCIAVNVIVEVAPMDPDPLRRVGGRRCYAHPPSRASPGATDASAGDGCLQGFGRAAHRRLRPHADCVHISDRSNVRGRSDGLSACPDGRLRHGPQPARTARS